MGFAAHGLISRATVDTSTNVIISILVISWLKSWKAFKVFLLNCQLAGCCEVLADEQIIYTCFAHAFTTIVNYKKNPQMQSAAMER